MVSGVRGGCSGSRGFRWGGLSRSGACTSMCASSWAGVAGLGCIQAGQSLNARNVRYEPHGPREHFPGAIFGQPKATRQHTDSDSSSSDSDTSSTPSGSSLTSAEENEE